MSSAEEVVLVVVEVEGGEASGDVGWRCDWGAVQSEPEEGGADGSSWGHVVGSST